MVRMLCRNKIADFDRWKAVFDSHKHAHRQAGLFLEILWRGLDDPNEVFFIFSLADLGRTRSFISAPDAAETAKQAGVIEGQVWFLREAIEVRVAA
jgi:hypothetical protein